MEETGWPVSSLKWKSVSNADFQHRRLATIDCTFAGSYNQSLEITGTEGIMRIEFPYQHP